MTSSTAIAHALRLAYPKTLARLLAITHDLDQATDALHDAIERALKRWPTQGIPDVPEAWLLTVARRRNIDQQRHQSRRVAILHELAQSPLPSSSDLYPAGTVQGWRDDVLRLMFTCCDPVLHKTERVALTLASVFGMSAAEIAGAFLVTQRTMEQRLTRARQRLKQRRGTYETPSPNVVPDRIESVLAVVYLVFNEGFLASTPDAPPIRRALCEHALHICRMLHTMLPDNAEVAGLLALLTMHQGRILARLDAEGKPVPLRHQNRTLWDHTVLRNARKLLHNALQQRQPGPYQIEAAIAAVHCDAATADATNWTDIANLYKALERVRPTPTTRLGRAFALAQADAPEEGLLLLESIASERNMKHHFYFHVVHTLLLIGAGQFSQARTALTQAQNLAKTDAERAYILELRGQFDGVSTCIALRNSSAS